MTQQFTRIELTDAQGATTIELDGGGGNIYAGGQGTQGDIALKDEGGNESIHLDGGGGNITIGGGGHEGDIGMLDVDGNQSIHLDGGGGNITLGGQGHNADVRLLDKGGKLTIHLDGGTGEVKVHGSSLKPADFVLAADYALPSLEDVRSFVHRNGHLPRLHSGEEMKARGVNLVDFTMTLLQKVEELTLYLIKQDDVIRQQQGRLEQVEKVVRQ
ncbi:MAG: hypothetical protein ACRDTT_05040 [Pseudonocardiaceae bacterium]